MNESGSPPGQGQTAKEEIEETALSAEITFWQEMIHFRDATITEEALERMEHALALAQKRLHELTVESARRSPGGRRSGTVVSLRRHKRSY